MASLEKRFVVGRLLEKSPLIEHQKVIDVMIFPSFKVFLQRKISKKKERSPMLVSQVMSSSFEDDLVQDVLEIITIFSARLYEARSRKNKKLVEALRNATSEI